MHVTFEYDLGISLLLNAHVTDDIKADLYEILLRIGIIQNLN